MALRQTQDERLKGEYYQCQISTKYYKILNKLSLQAIDPELVEGERRGNLNDGVKPMIEIPMVVALSRNDRR